MDCVGEGVVFVGMGLRGVGGMGKEGSQNVRKTLLLSFYTPPPQE
jgi:hypothetical protein